MVFALLGGFVIEVSDGSHDTFEWWADIFIPSLVGLTTVGVSVVALVVSHNASKLARNVEDQRSASEAEREREARRRRLQDLALDDARTLNRWVVESSLPRWGYSRPLNEPSTRSDLEQAKVDAKVAFEQSIVPGANELFTLTKYDLENRSTYIEVDRDERVILKAQKSRIAARREQRTRDRIRAWALDPEREAPGIAGEVRDLEDAPTDYLMFGEDPTFGIDS